MIIYQKPSDRKHDLCMAKKKRWASWRLLCVVGGLPSAEVQDAYYTAPTDKAKNSWCIFKFMTNSACLGNNVLVNHPLIKHTHTITHTHTHIYIYIYMYIYIYIYIILWRRSGCKICSNQKKKIENFTLPFFISMFE